MAVVREFLVRFAAGFRLDPPIPPLRGRVSTGQKGFVYVHWGPTLGESPRAVPPVSNV
jgi:hypothetical protein